MAISKWIIVILLVVSFYQYNSPDKANKTLEPIWGPVNNFIGENNPFGNNKNESSICPDIDAQVCGDNGKPYKNSCEAALDDV